jgi:O-antigen/teichoic acid export membrane protein
LSGGGSDFWQRWTGYGMKRDRTILFTTVTSAVLAAGIVLYYPVLIESGDDDISGLNFILLLIPGLAAVVPIMVSALVNGRLGRRDRWVPSVASLSVVVAAVLLIDKDGRQGSVVPTAVVVIAIFVATSVVSTWIAERFPRGAAQEDLSGGR